MLADALFELEDNKHTVQLLQTHQFMEAGNLVISCHVQVCTSASGGN